MSKDFRAKLRPAQYLNAWQAQFVLSHEPVDKLPKSMAEQGRVRNLCVASVDLKRVKKIRRNTHWWNLGKSYELAHILVQLIPGHTDLKIRLLSGNSLVNTEDDYVDVDWAGAGNRQSFNSTNGLDQPYAG